MAASAAAAVAAATAAAAAAAAEVAKRLPRDPPGGAAEAVTAAGFLLREERESVSTLIKSLRAALWAVPGSWAREVWRVVEQDLADEYGWSCPLC